MRWILLPLLYVLMQAPANAQSVYVERVELLDTGIMKETSELKSIDNKSISTGQRVEANTKIVEKTTTIPAKKNTLFGADVRFIGKPKGGMVDIKVIWHYPEPGLTNPNTNVTKRKDEYTVARKIGDLDTFFWSLQSEWVLVPGVWRLELYQGDRKLFTQDFTLVK